MTEGIEHLYNRFVILSLIPILTMTYFSYIEDDGTLNLRSPLCLFIFSKKFSPFTLFLSIDHDTFEHYPLLSVDPSVPFESSLTVNSIIFLLIQH